jgi:predicted GNAT superfamily acetyltransferase
MDGITFRDLHTLAECRRIVDLEKRIWGYSDPEDMVPAIMLMLSAKRGGMLIGAESADGVLQGFAFSMASIVDGKPAQWSHMMGVLPEFRAGGLGRALKLAQRERALRMGLDLIEWTFDPLQAVNAHLNFARLGVISTTYAENIYGDSSSVLHRGTPTDRLIVEWWIREPHVRQRIDGASLADVPARDSSVAAAVPLNALAGREPWDIPAARTLAPEGERVLIRAPARFSDLLAADAELARAWRQQTRALFTTCFARGYRAVDFLKDGRGGGTYLLTREAV